MRKGRFLFLVLLACLQGMAGALLFTRDAVDLMWTSAANATPQAGVVAVSGSCGDTPVTAFSPDAAYTLTFTASSAASSPSAAATVALIGAVNSDTAPSVTTSLTDVGGGGYAILSNRTPTIKIGGLVCTTEDRAKLEVYGDGTDNLATDIAILTVGSSAWDAAKKVDAATSSTKIVLFGPSGQVGTSPIVDGSDSDGRTNGEVAFGGTVASQGGSKIYVKQDYTGYDVDPAVARETLTFSLTPQ